MSNKGLVRILRANVAKAETEEKKITDRILREVNEEVANSLSNQCNIVINQQGVLEKEVKELEVQNTEYESEAETDFPDYDTFLNLFKKLRNIIKSRRSELLLEKVSIIVIVNMSLGDKEVVSYQLKPPFDTIEKVVTVTNGVQ